MYSFVSLLPAVTVLLTERLAAAAAPECPSPVTSQVKVPLVLPFSSTMSLEWDRVGNEVGAQEGRPEGSPERTPEGTLLG
jgi:hypothetical protein